MQFRDGEGRDSGPRPTPTIKDDKVFVCNTDGLLACLDLQKGATIWSRYTKKEFNSTATWHGFVTSPLVTGRAMIVPVGGTNSGLVAFDCATGKVLWKTLSEKASASSPLLASIDGKSRLIVITRSAIHALDPETGNDYWSLPTRRQTTGDLYAANPVLFGDYLFVSGCYRLGAQLLQFEHGRPKKVWHLDDSLNTHFANAIHDAGFLYGFHGHAGLPEGRNLRCIEASTGKVFWEEPQTGSGTILRAGGNLIILLETGELELARATPKGFQVLSRAQVVGKSTRTYPAIVDGYVFIKGPNTLVCLDLRRRR